MFLIFILVSCFYSDFIGAPFIPNNDEVILESLKLAAIKPGDTLLDMGSGDGKVLFIAVKTFGVKKAIGYEISPWPYLLSKVRLRYQNSSISKRIKVYKKSLFKADLSDVNVIYVYLFPGLLEKLYPMLKKAEKENKSLRIVSPVFKINNLKSKKVINIYHAGWKKNINIYLY